MSATLNENPVRRKKIEFTNEQRNAILQFLLPRSANGKLRKGAIGVAANEFKCNPVTISRIWKRAAACYAAGKRCANVDSMKKIKCGRKRKDYSENINRMREVPFNRRRNLRSLSFAIDVPKSTLFRIFKRGDSIKRVSNSIKPYLTEQNKQERVQFCLSKITIDLRFEDFYDTIHIDEKWFYLTQVNQTYYICLDEEPPHRTCKSKRFITKVMFLAAVARPRFDENNKCTFDGKLGIWPFTKQEAAKRGSKNRPKGTIETKLIDSITQEEIRKMMLEKLYPAIKEKWPAESRNIPIVIQQDNARPHLDENDKLLAEEGSKDGWNIQLKAQPANSPDMNVLDLGFFNSIQSLQYQSSPSNIDELVAATIKAYNDESPETLNKVFLSYQQAMLCVLKENGSNKYKLSHMHKDKLLRNGELPVTLECSPQLVQSAEEYLEECEFYDKKLNF